MFRLWAPWRMKYIEEGKDNSLKKTSKSIDCIFCSIVKEKDSVENLILKRGEYCYIVLNKFPYSNGHLMVVPFRHIRNLEELESKEYNEIFSFVQLSVSVLKKSFKADGFNVGFNLGETAGAGIAQHLHMHVVPRWNGDHNLMSVISETRVLPESLETTYSTLFVYFSG
ncbi:MAG: HIT family protein [bacterium]